MKTQDEKIKQEIEDYADAEYDITREGYRRAYLWIEDGKIKDAIKLLSFARKRLREEISMSNRMGMGEGNDRLKEKIEELTTIIDCLKDNEIEEAVKYFSMSCFPFQYTISRLEAKEEKDEASHQAIREVREWLEKPDQKRLMMDWQLFLVKFKKHFRVD